MARGRANTIYVVAALTAMMLIACCAVPALIRPHREAQSSSEAEAIVKASKVLLAWEAKTGPVGHIAFAPGGKYLGVITPDGTLQIYSSGGAKRYSVRTQDADRIVVSPDGNYTLVYSYQNSSNKVCKLINSSGRVIWDVALDSAVWSADVCSIDGGARFVVGTGGRRVYIIDIGRNRKKYHWWRTEGAVVSVDVDPEGSYLVIGTWQNASVERRTAEGRKIWSIDTDPASLPYVESLSSPHRYSIRYVPNRMGTDGAYELRNLTGDGIASGKIDASERTRVLFSPTGEHICLGYSEQIEHKGSSMLEKRTVLQDASGRQLWEKGSLFFQTEPILVTSHGEVLIRDGKNMLFITGPSGNLQRGLKLPANVEKCAASSDGFLSAISCSDGHLYMVKVTP